MSLARKTPLRSKTRMAPVSAKRRKHRDSAEGKAGLAHMLRVKQLPCVICWRHGPSDAHHCIHDRYGTDKRSDFAVIPLCKAHHQDGPDAIHNGKATWRAKYGADYEYLPVVADMLAGELTAVERVNE